MGIIYMAGSAPDTSTLYGQDTLLGWAGVLIKLAYYITHYYDVTSYYASWFASMPAFLLTIAGIANAYDLFDVPYSTDELSIFVNEQKFGAFTLGAVMYAIGQVVSDIPGIYNSSEFYYANYWGNMQLLNIPSSFSWSALI